MNRNVEFSRSRCCGSIDRFELERERRGNIVARERTLRRMHTRRKSRTRWLNGMREKPKATEFNISVKKSSNASSTAKIHLFVS